MEITLLEDLSGSDLDDAGGKAATLSRLLRAGFAVPPGFVLLPEAAYAIALSERPDPGLVARIGQLLVTIGADDGPVAVRSSASDEDGADASFAGQHLTRLDVRGTDAVADAVRACVLSLESESAAAYRSQRAGGAAARMAVLVQRMVAADAAGVAFTADPLSGDTGTVVVEAVKGLGESLVSGERAAQRFTFARDALALQSIENADEAALDEAQAREVAKLALAVEAALDAGPQDIEFAIADGNTWLLQSRPLTGSAESGPGEFDTPTTDADLWTSANIGEVLPGILTPLTITAFADNGNEAYCRAYQGLKMLAKDERPRFAGFFYNRAFLHVPNTRLIADRAFGSNADVVEERFLGAEKDSTRAREHSLRNIKHRFQSAVPLLRMLQQIVERGDAAERRTLTFERGLRATDIQALSGPQLDDLRLSIQDLVSDTFAVHLQASACAGAGYDLVARLARRALKEETEGKIPALFAGMHDVESARISLDIWGLAEIAKSTGIADRLRDTGFDPIAPSLPAEWVTAFKAFIERHGHRGLSEMEPAVPNWRRDAAQVLRLVSDYVELPVEQAPPRVLERRVEERLALTAGIERDLDPLNRRLFRKFLRDAQAYVALRERTKSVIVRGTRFVDVLLPEFGRRLVEGGAIADPDDVFFVTGDELSAALHAEGAMRDLRGAVNRRRRDFERNRYLQLPERFRGRPVPIEPEALEGVDVLRGTPVSTGVATGRARVILDPRTDGPLKPGEILVAPVTDAGWTPLFALAAGLVVDIGSALSHGSTVAREYGLPAVVNVRSGTTAIKTGDLVQVNGAGGTVTILERAAG